MVQTKELKMNLNLHCLRSEQADRGPLLEGWQERCSPVMTAYKLVTIDAPYWGFGYRLEQALLAGERALFLESHRNCFSWIDEWFGMTMQQIRDIERQGICYLNEKLGKPALASEEDHGSQRYSFDTEDIYSKRSQISSELLGIALAVQEGI